MFQDFPSQIVHIAVNCVDQYLMRRKVQRSELQLLGITCMLIAARSVLKSIAFSKSNRNLHVRQPPILSDYFSKIPFFPIKSLQSKPLKSSDQ